MLHAATGLTAVFHHAKFQHRSTLTFGVMQGTDKLLTNLQTNKQTDTSGYNNPLPAR